MRKAHFCFFRILFKWEICAIIFEKITQKDPQNYGREEIDQLSEGED